VAEEEEVVGEEEEVDVNTSLNKYNKLLDNKYFFNSIAFSCWTVPAHW
jgi:hypothetical protein